MMWQGFKEERDDVTWVSYRWVIELKKKLVREGKDRYPGIILRKDRNIVPAEKIPEPWPSTNGRSTDRSATAKLEGDARYMDPWEREGHSEEIF
jgi:hypothetical protein